MNEYKKERKDMVLYQIKNRGIKNKKVLDAMLKIPRHLFVPNFLEEYAYDDCALSIPFGQTISQPYIVAFMTEIIDPNKKKKALEIGTGSGYQTAILAELCKEVVTVEVIEELHTIAKQKLKQLKYKNITCIFGDGYKGYQAKAPYDIIIVTACPEEIPPKLIEQLAINGKMIIPIGTKHQYLKLVTKNKDSSLSIIENIEVRFVPMVHK